MPKKDTDDDVAQPPPPDPNGPESDEDEDRGRPKAGHPHHHDQPSAIDLLHAQLLDVRKVLDQLAEQAEADRVRRRHEYVPVRASDLMRGFQAAVARANRAVITGELEGQDIEDMAVRDLRVSISAPVIDSGHAEDPTLMLPNIKSVDEQSARISLEFSVMSMPKKTQG